MAGSARHVAAVRADVSGCLAGEPQRPPGLCGRRGRDRRRPLALCGPSLESGTHSRLRAGTPGSRVAASLHARPRSCRPGFALCQLPAANGADARADSLGGGGGHGRSGEPVAELPAAGAAERDEVELRFERVARAALAPGLCAAQDKMAEALRKGIVEEDTNQNLNAAIQSYQSVVTQYDEDRKSAATALFRLAECYRKQGKNDQATAAYKRVVQEFADQNKLAEQSRSHLPKARQNASG